MVVDFFCLVYIADASKKIQLRALGALPTQLRN